MADGPEVVRNNTGKRWLVTAHDDVKSVLGRNEIFRDDGEVNPDTGVLLDEFGRQRGENESRIVTRRLNAQCAERSGLDVAPLGDIVVEFGEDLQALLKQAAACFCQHQTMRRPVENAETQRLFQLLHPLADDRWPGAQLGSSFGEALALCDADERIELVQVPEHRGNRHLSSHQSLVKPPGRRGRFLNNSCSEILATNLDGSNVKCLFNVRNE